tara:strand:+ start:1394 stop:2227 length:834 start_codon:yes stop_codon:yes gene_type:complete
MDLTVALYIVPTPIGHLDDISRRAVHVLSEVDLIACEDTRHSGKLLQHLGIQSKLIALHDHNEKQKVNWIADQLAQQKTVALISDAGTPLISDPGYHLVSHLRQQGYKVIPLPGACAAITALSAAGLPSDRFCFEGFLPAKAKARLDKLALLKEETRSLIFYESPRRVLDTVNAMIQAWGEQREVVLARELTKTFETFIQGTLVQVKAVLEEDENQQKGEFVILCRGYQPDPRAISQQALNTLALLKQDLPLKKSAAITAQIYGLNKKQLYEAGLEL